MLLGSEYSVPSSKPCRERAYPSKPHRLSPFSRVHVRVIYRVHIGVIWGNIGLRADKFVICFESLLFVYGREGNASGQRLMMFGQFKSLKNPPLTITQNLKAYP